MTTRCRITPNLSGPKTSLTIPMWGVDLNKWGKKKRGKGSMDYSNVGPKYSEKMV